MLDAWILDPRSIFHRLNFDVAILDADRGVAGCHPAEQRREDSVAGSGERAARAAVVLLCARSPCPCWCLDQRVLMCRHGMCLGCLVLSC
eukprot:2646590-Rhodomonas_salina.3